MASGSSVSASLGEAIQQIYTALKHADIRTGVLENPFSQVFFEESPALITTKYLDYLDEQQKQKEEETEKKESEEEKPNDSEESSKPAHESKSDKEDLKTTISQRYEEGYYTSVYKLYHDLKLSSALLISSSKLGSQDYINVDNFYKFATGFLLQEAYRLHLGLKEFENAAYRSEEQSELSEFSEGLAHDFNKISTSFKYANDESLFILTGQNNNLPLFSSLSKRSQLDENEFPIPQPFNTMKVLPLSTSVPAANLGFVSPGPTKTPQNPASLPTEITRQIFHPNWFSLPSIPWLEFQFSNSFVPLIDETISVINSKNKGKVYFEQVGLQKLVKLRDAYYEQVNAASTTESGEKEEVAKPQTGKIEEEEDDGNISDKTEDEKQSPAKKPQEEPNGNSSEGQKANGDSSIAEDTNGHASEKPGSEQGKRKPGTLDINVKNLFEWKPQNKFEEDEIEAFKNGEEQEYVNKLLIDLNKLRAERYVTVNRAANSNSKVSKLSTKERNLHSKIKRMLENIVSHVKPSDLVDNGSGTGIKLSQNIPVLRMNYSGTLQAPIPIQYNAGRSTQRLAGLQTHRTYKKRKYQ